MNIKLTTVEYDTHVGRSDDERLKDFISYQKLVEKLLYLTITRLDNSFAVQVLSQFMQQPKLSHWNAALRLIGYIKGSPRQGIFLKRGSDIGQLEAFYDSDWTACPNTRRSITRYAMKLGDSSISWKSKKQQTISRSSAETEYRSMATTLTEVVWLEGLLHELSVEVSKPIKLFSDSKATMEIAANPIYHERIKHIEIDCHFIREKIKNRLIQPEYLGSKQQLADLFTKGLGEAQHHYLLSKFGVLDVYHPPA
ncbi:secreted RxLR effector protein 161-like [Nicotiana tabacum]|uniref:Secreted RxLR effector protein 161-like n=1 Tax=Nicotiana tabacum TaxID=4097 RepID=A0AC58SE71_TOBAC